MILFFGKRQITVLAIANAIIEILFDTRFKRKGQTSKPEELWNWGQVCFVEKTIYLTAYKKTTTAFFIFYTGFVSSIRTSL